MCHAVTMHDEVNGDFKTLDDAYRRFESDNNNFNNVPRIKVDQLKYIFNNLKKDLEVV